RRCDLPCPGNDRPDRHPHHHSAVRGWDQYCIGGLNICYHEAWPSVHFPPPRPPRQRAPAHRRVLTPRRRASPQPTWLCSTSSRHAMPQCAPTNKLTSPPLAISPFRAHPLLTSVVRTGSATPSAAKSSSIPPAAARPKKVPPRQNASSLPPWRQRIP